MEENKEVTTNTNEPAGSPEDPGEKLFTQAEVDKIVESRLGRFKDKMQKTREQDASEADARAADLTARESKVACWEYIIEKGYPRDLLDIIGTSDVEAFKAKADKLAELKQTAPGYPAVKDAGEVVKTSSADDLSKAFSRDNKHVPKAPPIRW